MKSLSKSFLPLTTKAIRTTRVGEIWTLLINLLINSWKSLFYGRTTEADIGIEVGACKARIYGASSRLKDKKLKNVGCLIVGLLE